MGFVKEFKEFAMKGNVIDMAVGVVIGGAFGKIVSSLVTDIVMPPIGLLIGDVKFSQLKLILSEAETNEAGEVLKEAVSINYGNFIEITIQFIIIALAIFIVIKGINKMKRKEEEKVTEPAAPPALPADVQLLTEIRDLLKKN